MLKYKVDVQPAIMKNPLVEQPLRVAAYCRVSADSEEQLGSLETQIKFYTDHIRRQLNLTLAGIYSDNVSGIRLKKRVGHKQMMRDCKKGNGSRFITRLVSWFWRMLRDPIDISKGLKLFDKPVTKTHYTDSNGGTAVWDPNVESGNTLTLDNVKITPTANFSALDLPDNTTVVVKGTLSGKGGGVLEPQGKATRAAAAAMLMRYARSLNT